LGHIISPVELRELVVNQNVRPERPENDEAPQLTDEVWQLMQRSWDGDALSRPTSVTLCDDIRSILDSRQSSLPASSEPKAIESSFSRQYFHDTTHGEHREVSVEAFPDRSVSSSLSQWQSTGSSDEHSTRSSSRLSARNVQLVSQDTTPSNPSTSVGSPSSTDNLNSTSRSSARDVQPVSQITVPANLSASGSFANNSTPTRLFSGSSEQPASQEALLSNLSTNARPSVGDLTSLSSFPSPNHGGLVPVIPSRIARDNTIPVGWEQMRQGDSVLVSQDTTSNWITGSMLPTNYSTPLFSPLGPSHGVPILPGLLARMSDSAALWQQRRSEKARGSDREYLVPAMTRTQSVGTTSTSSNNEAPHENLPEEYGDISEDVHRVANGVCEAQDEREQEPLRSAQGETAGHERSGGLARQKEVILEQTEMGKKGNYGASGHQICTTNQSTQQSQWTPGENSTINHTGEDFPRIMNRNVDEPELDMRYPKEKSRLQRQNIDVGPRAIPEFRKPPGEVIVQSQMGMDSQLGTISNMQANPYRSPHFANFPAPVLERQASLPSFEPNSYRSPSGPSDYPEHGSFGIGSHPHRPPSTSRMSAHTELANRAVYVAANSERMPSSFQGAEEERSIMTKTQEREREMRIMQNGYYHAGFGTKHTDNDAKPPLAGPNSASAKLSPIIPAENPRPSNIRSHPSNNSASRPMTNDYSFMAGEPNHFPQSFNSLSQGLRDPTRAPANNRAEPGLSRMVGDFNQPPQVPSPISQARTVPTWTPTNDRPEQAKSRDSRPADIRPHPISPVANRLMVNNVSSTVDEAGHFQNSFSSRAPAGMQTEPGPSQMVDRANHFPQLSNTPRLSQGRTDLTHASTNSHSGEDVSRTADKSRQPPQLSTPTFQGQSVPTRAPPNNDSEPVHFAKADNYRAVDIRPSPSRPMSNRPIANNLRSLNADHSPQLSSPLSQGQTTLTQAPKNNGPGPLSPAAERFGGSRPIDIGSHSSGLATSEPTANNSTFMTGEFNRIPQLSSPHSQRRAGRDDGLEPGVFRIPPISIDSAQNHQPPRDRVRL
jgi:hypothetical protein